VDKVAQHDIPDLGVTLIIEFIEGKIIRRM